MISVVAFKVAHTKALIRIIVLVHRFIKTFTDVV
jgi:hypothetical protein